MDKSDASNFFGAIRDNINDECYEEGCTFNEIVNYYGQSESSVSWLNYRIQGHLFTKVPIVL